MSGTAKGAATARVKTVAQKAQGTLVTGQETDPKNVSKRTGRELLSASMLVRMTPAEHEAVMKQAADRGMTGAAYVRQAIRQALGWIR